MRKFIIDTDTASDDAVALIMALRDPNIQVVAFTEVAGNVPLDLACQNASVSIGMANTYVPPIYAGCTTPLLRDQIFASNAHGKKGLGDEFEFFDPGHKPEAEHAVNAIIRMIREGDGDISLLLLGPATNVALALKKAPDIAKKIPEIIMMGGCGLGETANTPVAEFNILADPEAADTLCQSGIHITFVPLEACHGDAKFLPEDFAALRSFGKPRADFVIDCNVLDRVVCNERYGIDTIMLADPAAMTYAAHPEYAKVKFDCYARVVTTPGLSYGQVVLNMRPEGGKCNATFVPELFGRKHMQYLLDCMK